MFRPGIFSALDRAEILLRCGDYSDSPLEFKIDGIELEVDQVMCSSEGRVLVDFPLKSIGRFLMVSGYEKLSDIRAISFVPVCLRVE